MLQLDQATIVLSHVPHKHTSQQFSHLCASVCLVGPSLVHGGHHTTGNLLGNKFNKHNKLTSQLPSELTEPIAIATGLLPFLSHTYKINLVIHTNMLMCVTCTLFWCHFLSHALYKRPTKGFYGQATMYFSSCTCTHLPPLFHRWC